METSCFKFKTYLAIGLWYTKQVKTEYCMVSLVPCRIDIIDLIVK